mgnify:CR=1 FL=1
MGAIKAHIAGLSTVALFLIGRFTGLVEMPPMEDFTTALLNIGGAALSFGISWLATYLSPANKT